MYIAFAHMWMFLIYTVDSVFSMKCLKYMSVGNEQSLLEITTETKPHEGGDAFLNG